MNKYEFALYLSDQVELSDALADVLFAAGCVDGTPGSQCGRFVIDFARESTSLELAISTAIADVSRAGYEVEHIEIAAGALLKAI